MKSEEIRAAELDPAEEAQLATERNRLANSEQLATLAAEAARLLNGDDSARAAPAVDSLMGVAAALAKLAQIDPAMADDYALAESMAQQAQELALTLSRYASDVEFDPFRLDELEERLELITSLKRRFRADSIADLLAYAERATAELQGIDASDERLAELSRRADELLRQIGDISARLSRARAEAGSRRSADKSCANWATCAWPGARFEVLLQQAEHPAGCYVGERRYKFDAKGMDDVEFMLSANPGEPPRPLAKVASGGEAARIMLALKRVLTAADQTPILIFDEVDQGIGGRIGAVVGEKLWSLTGEHQVLCVTHLPQLASLRRRAFSSAKGAGRRARGDASPRAGIGPGARRRAGGDAGRARRRRHRKRAGVAARRCAGGEGDCYQPTVGPSEPQRQRSVSTRPTCRWFVRLAHQQNRFTRLHTHVLKLEVNRCKRV